MDRSEIRSKSVKTIYLLIYLSWFGCVYAGKFNLSEYSLLIPLMTALVINKYVAKINRRFISAILGLSFFGFLFDSFSRSWGWIVIPDASPGFGAPIWLLSLWLLLSVSLPLYLPWLKNKMILSALLGLIFGPLSYKGGESLNVLFFSDKIVFLYYAIFWALLFPASIFLTRWSMLDYKKQL